MFGDVLDVKVGRDLIDVKPGVEKGNVDDVVKAFEVVGSEIFYGFYGVSDVVNVAKSEIGIGVDVEDVEEVLSAVGVVNDENADKKLVDVVDQ